MGDSNVTDTFINAMREFAAVKGQFRPTEVMGNAGGQIRTRADAPLVLGTTSGRGIHGEKPVIEFDDGFYGGI